MRTQFPSTTICFVFAHTYCRVVVHEEQAFFMRRVLSINKAEFLLESEHPNRRWTEWDAGILLHVVCDTLPRMLAEVAPSPGEIVNMIAARLALPQLK